MPRPSLARATGIAYLGIIAAGLFAELAVRAALVVDGDPVATTEAIARASSLFRAGIVADVAMVVLDAGVAVGLLAIFEPVDRTLARLAAALRLLQGAVIAANLMNPVGALLLATGPAPAPEHVAAAMQVHALVYDLGLVFFGFSCLVLGRLLLTARSTLLGTGLVLAGGVYLLGSTAALCAPELSPTLDPLYGLAFLAELAFAGRLLAGRVDVLVACPSHHGDRPCIHSRERTSR